MKKQLLLVVAMSAFLVACGTETDSSDAETTPETSSETAVGTSLQEETETEDSQAEEPSGSDVGTRTNPVPVGEAVTLEDTYYDDEMNNYDALYELKITNVVRGEEAFNTLVSENQFNEQAPEGMEWVIVTLEGELLEGDENVPYTIVPWFTVMDSSGSEVPQDAYATFSGDEYGYVDLFPGATTSGRIAMYVPEGDDALLVSEKGFSSNTYFSLNE